MLPFISMERPMFKLSLMPNAARPTAKLHLKLCVLYLRMEEELAMETLEALLEA